MSQSNRLAIIAFWFLGLIWGSNFIFMKWAAAYISPAQIVLLRVAFGIVPIAVYALATGTVQRGHARLIPHFVVMSLLATSAYYYGFAKGTELLPSGIAGALSGAIPVFAFIASAAFLSEGDATTQKLIGVLLGLVGVVLIANPFGIGAGEPNLEGAFWMVFGSMSLGVSFVYARRFLAPHHIPPAALATYQLGLAFVLLLVMTELRGMQTVFADPKAALGLVVGLGILGTGLAYVAYYYIVSRLGALRAASVTYIPPVVALVIGAGLAGETIPLMAYVATALIFAGVALINRRRG